MLNMIFKLSIKIASAILCAVLFLGILGTAYHSSSALQGFETPSSTLTIPTFTIEPSPSETPIPTSPDNSPEKTSRPLPAIFSTGAYVADELIVRFKPSAQAIQIEECLRGVDVQIHGEIEELRSLVLKVESGGLGKTFSNILGCPGVMYVEPNFLLQATDTIPNDPNWGLQYGLINIRAPQGWDLATGSDSVTIAIIDTGVDYGHLDLASKLVAGYDFVNKDADPQDDNGHGTHVAGIAAASSNNGTGIAGVSWGARIMPVKVLDSAGRGTYANTALGVLWAVDHGAQVINLSLGGTGPSSVLADAINYAHGQSVVIVAAAGNTGANFVLYPARYPNVIAVAKTNNTNNWDVSNYGPEIDLSAPGALIYSTVVGGYDYKSGSSMSTGYVSGLAAILKGIGGNVSPDVIETQMESTALDIEFAGWDEYTGAGLIQMDAAILLALPPTSIPQEQDSSSSAGGGNIPGQIVPTNTPIPTWTVSLTSPVEPGRTVSATETASVTVYAETRTSTPTQTEIEVEAQGDSETPNYFLPCTGLLLIVLGVFLVLFLGRKSIDD